MPQRHGRMALLCARPEPPAESEDDAPPNRGLNATANPPSRRGVHWLVTVQPPINSRIPAPRRQVVGASSATAVAAANAALVRAPPQKPLLRIPAPKHNVGASSGTSAETKVQGDRKAAAVAAANADAAISVRKRADPADPDALDLTHKTPPNTKRRRSYQAEPAAPTRRSQRLAPFYIVKDDINEPKCYIPTLPPHFLEYTSHETNTVPSKDKEETKKLAWKYLKTILGKDDVTNKFNASTSHETHVEHLKEHISCGVQPSPESLYNLNLLANAAHFQSQKEKEEEREIEMKNIKANPSSQSRKRNLFMAFEDVYINGGK